MDSKSLNALNNLSDAIDQLSQAIIDAKQKPGNSGNPLTQAVDLVSQLKEINQSLSEIKEDNQKMMSKQDEILKLSKEIKNSKEKGNVFAQVGDNKQKIKDGVSSIVTIAVGVLAIGMAFKLVGKVDFLSVIALGLAIPLIAMAFSEVIKTKITIKDALVTSAALVIMAAALALASMALAFVEPLSFAQLITTIGIGFAFSLLANSIGELSAGIAKASVRGILMMPFVLIAASTAIMASSWILREVQPVGFYQLLTTIGIAGAFTVLSFGIGKLANSLKDINVKGVLALPLVLVTTALAIMGASFLLSQVQPVGMLQLLTSIGIAAVFVVISFGIAQLVKAMSKVEWSDVLKLPLLLVTISGAIWASSIILKDTAVIPFSTLLGIVLFSITLTIAAIALGAAMWVFDKLGLSIGNAIKGGFVVVIIAATIMASSLILSIGDYSNYPTIDWALGVGLSIVAFGLSMSVLGFIALSGIGAVALLAGAVAVLGVAATIVGVAEILGAGDYKNFPSVAWSTSVGLSMTSFALGMTILGGIIIGTFGLGGLMLEAGSNAMLTVAQTIVDVAGVLNGGTYTGGPTKAWAEGIGLAIGAFAPVYGYLMTSQVMSIFGGDAMTGEEYGKVMVGIADSIISVAGVFNNAGVSVWSNAPTKAWAEGVGLAIGAFAPVYAALDEGLGEKMFNLLTGSKSDKAEQMNNAMISIAGSIIAVAGIFNKFKADYSSGPTKSWGEGVGAAISGFAAAYNSLSDMTTFGKVTDKDIRGYNGALFAVVDSIIEVARRFNGAGDIFNTKISKSFFDNITQNVKAYLDLLDDIPLTGSLLGNFKLTHVINDITSMAMAYKKLAKAIGEVGTNLTQLGDEQFNNLKYLTANIAMLSLGDTDQLEDNIDLLEEKSETLATTFKKMSDELAKQNDLSVTSGSGIKTSTSVKTGSSSKVTKTNDDLYNALQQIDSKLATIASSANNLASYADELRGKTKPTINNRQ